MLNQISKNNGRISKTRDLQKVYRLGKAIHANTLVIKFILNKPNTPPRLAFVISKKISKKAVVRNKIRRVLREELRTKLLANMPSADYVIMVKSCAAKTDNGGLRQDIDMAAYKLLRAIKQPR